MLSLLIKFFIMSIMLGICLITNDLALSMFLSIAGGGLAWNIKKAYKSLKSDGEEIPDIMSFPSEYLLYGGCIFFIVCSLYSYIMPSSSNIFSGFIPNGNSDLTTGMQAYGINGMDNMKSMISTGFSFMNICNIIFCGSIIAVSAYEINKQVKLFNDTSTMLRLLEGRINRPYHIKNTAILTNGVVLKEGGILNLVKHTGLSWEITYTEDDKHSDISIITAPNYADLLFLKKTFSPKTDKNIL